MSRFSPEQIAAIIGPDTFSTDPVIVEERKRISEKYSELKGTRRWFPVEELRTYPGYGNADKGAWLLPDFTECTIRARAWWLEENVLNIPAPQAHIE